MFKSGITQIQNRDYPSDYDVYEVDSLLIIRINKIVIDKRAALEDEYHKAQILEDVDLRLLRQLPDGYPFTTDLSLARLISSIVFVSYSNHVFWVFEVIIIYFLTVPVFSLVFYYLRLRSKFDLVYYLFLFSLIAVFAQEWIFLGKIRL